MNGMQMGSSPPRRRKTVAAVRRTPLVALGSALVLGVATAGPLPAQEAVRLRLNSTAGESLTYKFELNLDIAVPSELGGNQRLESLMVLQQTTRNVRADTLYFDSSVQDASFSLRSAEGAQMLPDASAGLIGQNFRTAFTRRAEPVIIEIEGQPPQATAQVRSALRQGGFPTLPERAVRVGDRWRDTVRIRAADMGMAAPGFLVLINDISLQRLSRSGSSTIAEILVETAYDFEPDRDAFPGVSVEMIGSRADSVRFDVTRGHFLSARGAQDFTMSLSVPGLGQAFAVRGNGESSAGLVD
jgi:hypothetical protein